MPDDLDAMTDEQLNDTVATEVFGWPADSPGRLAYATDGNAMLEVIEKMRADGWSLFDIVWHVGFKPQVRFWRPHQRMGDASAATLPRAVAIAAVQTKRAEKHGAMT